MPIAGTVRVVCPACKTPHEVKLVQSVNARSDPSEYAKLVGGELNVLACECGKRMQLAAKLVFHDPDRAYFAQVGDVAEAKVAFAASGATGTLRVVPTLNALVEKVKLLEADLEDWAIEMTKLLLLAAETDAIDTVVLFDALDRDAGLIHWVRFDEDGPRRVASAIAAYDKLVGRDASRPRPDELEIDRAWAMLAVQSMMAAGN